MCQNLPLTLPLTIYSLEYTQHQGINAYTQNNHESLFLSLNEFALD